MGIIISGAAGRMGQAVARQALEEGVTITAGVDVRLFAADFPVVESFAQLPQGGEVIIDFSLPQALEGLLAFATAEGLPVVLATTGYSEAQLTAIDRAAETIPIFRSANMSVGVAVLRKLARQAAELLGPGFDVEIVEAHHNKKVDAPSGTALLLYDAVKDAYDLPLQAVYGRSGHCPRQAGEIGIHALRGGTVAGEHEVCFFGPMERITLHHSAENRAVFAAGALRAAQWLTAQAPGLYDMDDMLG